MTVLGTFADRYPVSHSLEDGAKITCSLMSPNDREDLSIFLARLPTKDLVYLQVDITQADVFERWLDSIAAGQSVCICAYDSAGLVGYAAVQLPKENDQPSGEIRVNLSQGYRSRGLGRVLTAEIFNIAKHTHLETVSARMVSDQFGAQAAFKRLGFVQTEVLKDRVKDSSGKTKDLLTMTFKL